MLLYHDLVPADQGIEPEREETRRLSRAERRRRVRAAQRTTRQELQRLMADGVLGLAIGAGLRELRRLCEEEADTVCGAPKGRHHAERKGYRHGTAPGWVVVGGLSLPFERPRVRTVDGKDELELETYKQAQDPRFLTEAVLAECLVRVSQREYRGVIRQLLRVPDEQPAGHTSHGTVGRRFIEGTQRLLEVILERRLDTQRYLVLWIDGKRFGRHQVLAALGLTDRGEKEVLGLWEGETENRAACQGLLEDLVRRGLSVEKGLLVVTDGGKGLAAAIDAVWGDRVLHQRCQWHKEQNVLDKLPEKERARAREVLWGAWDAKQSAEAAEKALRAFAAELERKGYEPAAASVREGLPETLTCQRLGVPEGLYPTLRTTNVIESAFSRAESLAAHVKRWQNGNQALRWAAAGLLQAEQSFAPLGDAAALAELAEILARHASGPAWEEAGVLVGAVT